MRTATQDRPFTTPGGASTVRIRTQPKRYWEPATSGVEKIPGELIIARSRPGIMPSPHWHAQVEINYLVRGTLTYRMHDHDITLAAGDICLFWGGQPHQVVDVSDDAEFFAVHLPLVHFFRVRLPDAMRNGLMHGATVTTQAVDGDGDSFARWAEYLLSEDGPRRAHAIDELLLRVERIQFEPYTLIPEGEYATGSAPTDSLSFRNVGRICTFITENFRDTIDVSDIASSANIHPKYAMSVFKKSTGMTLNEFINLLRLSYAQALLMQGEENVLRVAMESGFGSLSAFNNSFRKLSGVSPSAFRREARVRPRMEDMAPVSAAH